MFGFNEITILCIVRPDNIWNEQTFKCRVISRTGKIHWPRSPDLTPTVQGYIKHNPINGRIVVSEKKKMLSFSNYRPEILDNGLRIFVCKEAF